MTDLNFTKDSNGLYSCEFNVERAGTLLVNRFNGGSMSVYAKTDDITPICVDYEPHASEDYIAQIGLTGVTIRVESESMVKKAQFV